MTKSEEMAVRMHIHKASGLKVNARGDMALSQFLRIGELHYIRLGKPDTEELAKLLNAIGLQCYMDEEALRLPEEAFTIYYEKVMKCNIEKEEGYVLLRRTKI
jgi:hypothetical protein